MTVGQAIDVAVAIVRDVVEDPRLEAVLADECELDEEQIAFITAALTGLAREHAGWRWERWRADELVELRTMLRRQLRRSEGVPRHRDGRGRPRTTDRQAS